MEHGLARFLGFPGCSGALRLEALRTSAGKEPGQAQEVVGRAVEDEEPVHLGQSAQLHLAQRSGLLEPAEALSISHRQLRLMA